ncbi:hypothetical protein RvY_14932-1 [Ramazzottius varieornatus]|uniref:MARVEL domain-containing protein n=1 Tax=Ramazzottius varieornatus TaxID=947166 RepID=A0A1D1VWN9_RAMVA|nr:hypothetical protein RvY_14932-1 [Ramazzottius varieornatus]
MVTTTTKTLNYSIIRGNHTNSVNATITSTPGFNINYFGKIPGILKVLELIVTVVALGLAASRRREGTTTVVGWPVEYFLAGEVFFLCICAAALTYLFGQLTTFAWSVVSSVLIPKTTYFEIVINFLLFLAWATAGIVQLAMTCREAWNGREIRAPVNGIVTDANGNQIQVRTNAAGQLIGPGGIAINDAGLTRAVYRSPDMLFQDWGCRIAAGSLALFLSIFHLISFALAVKEFQGPRNEAR